MQTRTRNTFTSIHSEGSLLPAVLLRRIWEGERDEAALLEGLSEQEAEVLRAILGELNR